MGSVGAPELLVIFLVALIVLGPDRLPKVARQMGRAVAEFKRITSGFETEVRRAMDDVTGTAATPATTTEAPSAVPTAPDGSGRVGEVPPPDEGPLPVSPQVARPTVPLEDLPPPPDDPSRN